MSIRLLIILLFISAACQTGRIPCPKQSLVKVKQSNPNRNFIASPAAFSPEAGTDTNEQNIHARNYKKNDSRMVKNVSVEEWDCPRPGSKKYMPKSVKENIRKNMKRIRAGTNVNADSTNVNGNR